ncbi:hypothetical protein FSP39_016092 [Pinctada imbricata]|uniref:Ionotropic glutamate receptor C-terminal domain-containing protein n=1 Tax=Pinctada imbricata TaxID=66713 RepID=A0AA88Y1H8_PINIB|nr:hypothetical protein FSP39_016092 [Pinctada imbricata]
MGFTYIAREVRDGQYGVLLPNGTWTGIIGEVSQGYADLGVGPISTTAERETVIDFTAPYYDYAGLQILIYHSITPTSMFGFVETFDGYVWLVWMAFLVVTSTLLFVFHFLTYKVFSTKTKEEKLMSLSDALWFVMASISLQGPDRYRISFSSRVLVIGFWFFCQIMLATYTANMAAFMTSKRLSFDIKSLADLNDQNTLAYSALSGSASETYFRRMTAIEDRFFEVWRNMSYSSTESNDLTVWDYPLNDLYTRIFKEINKTGFITTSAEGVQRVLNERFAFIHETPMIKYEQTKHCNLEAAGEIFSSKPYAFVLPENSPLKKNFNSKILGFQSGTFLNTLKEKWWPDTLNCETEDDSTAGLPLNNLLGVIIMTSVGCALGIIILALEIYFYRRTKHKLQVCFTISFSFKSFVPLQNDLIPRFGFAFFPGSYACGLLI